MDKDLDELDWYNKNIKQDFDFHGWPWKQIMWPGRALISGVRKALGYPTISDFKRKQEAELADLDRWEKVPFPDTMDLTRKEREWRRKTYNPDSATSLGERGISNERMAELLDELSGFSNIIE